MGQGSPSFFPEPVKFFLTYNIKKAAHFLRAALFFTITYNFVIFSQSNQIRQAKHHIEFQLKYHRFFEK